MTKGQEAVASFHQSHLKKTKSHYKKPSFKLTSPNFFKRILGNVNVYNQCFYVNKNVQERSWTFLLT